MPVEPNTVFSTVVELLPLVKQVCKFFQEISDLSTSLDENRSCLEEKLKTLRALRDSVKHQISKYKSADNIQIVHDWLERVEAVEKRVQDIETKLTEKNKTPKWIHGHSRSVLNKEMKSVCSDMKELVNEGYQLINALNQLRSGQLLEDILNELKSRGQRGCFFGCFNSSLK